MVSIRHSCSIELLFQWFVPVKIFFSSIGTIFWSMGVPELLGVTVSLQRVKLKVQFPPNYHFF